MQPVTLRSAEAMYRARTGQLPGPTPAPEASSAAAPRTDNDSWL